jgi:hypothetical protein
MTGLAPAGALPLQAARSVANFAQEVMKGQLPLAMWGLGSQGVELFSRSKAFVSGLHLNLSRLNHRLPRGQAHSEVMQGTAEFHHQIANALFPQTDPIFHNELVASFVNGPRSIYQHL